MRIGLIAPPWTPIPPPLYGGIELVVDQLARGFQNAGHEVTLFTTGDSTCPVPRRFVLPVAEGERIGMAVPEIRHGLHAYEAVAGNDIVHDHTVMGPVYSERFANLPVVTTIHGPFNEELSDIYRAVTPRVHLVCISHSQASSAGEIPVSRVIHHGLDVEGFPFGNGQGGYCLFIGRMAPTKGAHRALAVARKAGIALKLIGKMREPWEFEYYEDQVRPHLGADAEYLGEVPHEEKIELLGNASALLFPIRWDEPFGMVMLEALACGTPVLAFPEGSVPEVVRDGVTGFICADEAEMVEALGRLGSLDRRDCRAAVEGYFSTSRMVEEHLELFSQILDR